MSVMQHQIDPVLAARLPERIRALLEHCVPFGGNYMLNLGTLMGVQFAQRLLETPSCTIEQIREAVAEAVKVTSDRLGRQMAEQQPTLSAKLAAARVTPEMIAACEAHSPEDPDDVPLDDFIRELEEKYGLPPESGAA